TTFVKNCSPCPAWGSNGRDIRVPYPWVFFFAKGGPSVKPPLTEIQPPQIRLQPPQTTIQSPQTVVQPPQMTLQPPQKAPRQPLTPMFSMNVLMHWAKKV